jgi:hypothetical protein
MSARTRIIANSDKRSTWHVDRDVLVTRDFYERVVDIVWKLSG